MTNLKIKVGYSLLPTGPAEMASGSGNSRADIEIIVDGSTGLVDRIRFKQPLNPISFLYYKMRIDADQEGMRISAPSHSIGFECNNSTEMPVEYVVKR